MTVNDLALQAYERALEPKRLVLIPGGHFDPYPDQFPRAEAEQLRGSASIIQRWTIEPEDTFLERRFGAQYSSYKEKVRRWI